MLGPAIRKRHRVGSGPAVVSISSLFSLVVGSRVVVRDSIAVGEGFLGVLCRGEAGGSGKNRRTGQCSVDGIGPLEVLSLVDGIGSLEVLSLVDGVSSLEVLSLVDGIGPLAVLSLVDGIGSPEVLSLVNGLDFVYGSVDGTGRVDSIGLADGIGSSCKTNRTVPIVKDSSSSRSQLCCKTLAVNRS